MNRDERIEALERRVAALEEYSWRHADAITALERSPCFSDGRDPAELEPKTTQQVEPVMNGSVRAWPARPPQVEPVMNGSVRAWPARPPQS